MLLDDTDQRNRRVAKFPGELDQLFQLGVVQQAVRTMRGKDRRSALVGGKNRISDD